MNIGKAEEACRRGEITPNTLRTMQDRYEALIFILNKAGYTDKHPVFEFPVKPN